MTDADLTAAIYTAAIPGGVSLVMARSSGRDWPETLVTGVICAIGATISRLPSIRGPAGATLYNAFDDAYMQLFPLHFATYSFLAGFVRAALGYP